MQTAETLLAVIRKRGTKGQPIERVYRMLYNKELYLKAYAKLYPNKGAMTPGVTPETADGMSTDKIDSIIEAIKYEHYQWKLVKRTYIKKTNGKLRPLGLPTWREPDRKEGGWCISDRQRKVKSVSRRSLKT